MIVRLDGVVEWTGFRDPESERWVGVCRALNLVVEGETWSEMQAEANEALVLLMREMLESGGFEQFLQEHGWRADLPRDVPPSDIIIDIPAPFMIKHDPVGDGVAYR